MTNQIARNSTIVKDQEPTHQEILHRATALARGEVSIGQIFGLQPADVHPFISLISALSAAGRPQDARVFLEGALALFPRDPRLQATAKWLLSAPCHGPVDRTSPAR